MGLEEMGDDAPREIVVGEPVREGSGELGGLAGGLLEGFEGANGGSGFRKNEPLARPKTEETGGVGLPVISAAWLLACALR